MNDDEHHADMYLPSAKQLPWENAVQTAERVVQERLNMQGDNIVFDFLKAECFEEEVESASYPGVPTIYRKEIYEGVMNEADDVEDEKRDERVFAWLDEAECEARGVTLHPHQTEISPLVHPP